MEGLDFITADRKSFEEDREMPNHFSEYHKTFEGFENGSEKGFLGVCLLIDIRK